MYLSLAVIIVNGHQHWNQANNVEGTRVNLAIIYRSTNWSTEGMEFQMSRSLVLKDSRGNLNILQPATVRVKRLIIMNWDIIWIET